MRGMPVSPDPDGAAHEEWVEAAPKRALAAITRLPHCTGGATVTTLTASLRSRHLDNREVLRDGPPDLPHDRRWPPRRAARRRGAAGWESPPDPPPMPPTQDGSRHSDRDFGILAMSKVGTLSLNTATRARNMNGCQPWQPSWSGSKSTSSCPKIG